MRCSEVMSTDIQCCTAVDTVVEAAQIMKTYNVGSVPVVSDKQVMDLIGIVTDRDLALQVVAENRNPIEVQVQDVMARDLVTCQQDDDITKAMKLMADYQVRRIPIVNSANRIVGIISQADVALRTPSDSNTGEVVEEISKPTR